MFDCLYIQYLSKVSCDYDLKRDSQSSRISRIEFRGLSFEFPESSKFLVFRIKLRGHRIFIFIFTAPISFEDLEMCISHYDSN